MHNRPVIVVVVVIIILAHCKVAADLQCYIAINIAHYQFKKYSLSFNIYSEVKY